MIRAWIQVVAVVAVALVAQFAAAGIIEIEHMPFECVPRDRYARIEASASPANDVANAELQFRTASGGSWYSIGMTGEGPAWSAVLPRASRPLTRFEYRIVMRSADLQESATVPFAVAVVGEDPADCALGERTTADVDVPIVVRVPAGAPLVPPVPSGFSPAGVVAAWGPRPKASNTKKWVALGAVGGAVATAAVAAASGTAPTPITTPRFEFFGVTPNPGAVLSISRDRLAVTMRVTGGDQTRLDFLWRVEFAASGGTVCAFTTSMVSVDRGFLGPGRPRNVVLTSPFHITGACPAPIEVESAHITIVLDGGVVYDRIHVLPYRLEP